MFDELEGMEEGGGEEQQNQEIPQEEVPAEGNVTVLCGYNNKNAKNNLMGLFTLGRKCFPLFEERNNDVKRKFKLFI